MEIIKTITIGKEYDNQLIEKLEDILLVEGAILTEKIEGLGGSQDYKSYKVKLKNSIIEIEIETYIGISISGESSIINHLESIIGGG